MGYNLSFGGFVLEGMRELEIEQRWRIAEHRAARVLGSIAPRVPAEDSRHVSLVGEVRKENQPSLEEYLQPYLHGDPANMVNATQSTFDTVFVYYHGGDKSAGVYLQFADGHLFNNLHVVGSVNAGGPCVMFDGQDAVDGFPGGNTFVCPAFSPNGVTGIGVIGPNQFVSYDDTNGAPIPSYPGLSGTTRTGVRFGEL